MVDGEDAMAKEDSVILRAYFFPLQGRWHFQNRIALGEDSFGFVPKDAYPHPGTSISSGAAKPWREP